MAEDMTELHSKEAEPMEKEIWKCIIDHLTSQ